MTRVCRTGSCHPADGPALRLQAPYLTGEKGVPVHEDADVHLLRIFRQGHRGSLEKLLEGGRGTRGYAAVFHLT